MLQISDLKKVKLHGLLRLPHEILLEAASLLAIPELRLLDRFNGMLSLVVRDYLLRHLYDSGLLCLSNNVLSNIAPYFSVEKMLDLGGKVNNRRYMKGSIPQICQISLSTVCYCGHEELVRLLLEAGASQHDNAIRSLLSYAIARRYEKIAVLLCRELFASTMLNRNPRETSACEARFFDLV
jgi:ankyrin repeat protein